MKTLRIIGRWLLTAIAVAGLVSIFWWLSSGGSKCHPIPGFHLDLDPWWSFMPIAAVLGMMYGVAEVVVLIDEKDVSPWSFVGVVGAVFAFGIVVDTAGGLAFVLSVGLTLLVSKRVRVRLCRWFWPE